MEDRALIYGLPLPSSSILENTKCANVIVADMTVYYKSEIFSIVLRSESTFSDAKSASSIRHNQYDNIFRKEIICFYKDFTSNQ